MHRVTVEYSDATKQTVKDLEESIRMLTGMVIEAIEQTPAVLLSPVYRRMIAEKAHECAKLHAKVNGRLHADAPGGQ